MSGWRPDRSFVMLGVAVLFTALGVPRAFGHHPDYALLGAAAPLWAAWATLDREDKRRRGRRRRQQQEAKDSDGEDGGPGE